MVDVLFSALCVNQNLVCILRARSLVCILFCFIVCLRTAAVWIRCIARITIMHIMICIQQYDLSYKLYSGTDMTKIILRRKDEIN